MADLSKLIDADLLQIFGEGTIVPLKGAIGSLAQAVAGLSDEVDDTSESIASTESSPAQATHAVGDYLMYAGELYRVTAAIAIGDTLTPGTNISKTTVTDELDNNGGGTTDVGLSVVDGQLCATFTE